MVELVMVVAVRLMPLMLGQRRSVLETELDMMAE
jgi:hypothetical protein